MKLRRKITYVFILIFVISLIFSVFIFVFSKSNIEREILELKMEIEIERALYDDEMQKDISSYSKLVQINNNILSLNLQISNLYNELNTLLNIGWVLIGLGSTCFIIIIYEKKILKNKN